MYSVNWANKIITIPKADTVLVSASPDVRSLDVNTLWATLIDIQDDPDSMAYEDIVLNTPPLTVAGLTLARVLQIINSYRLVFEDGLYAVNIIGGNSNIADVVIKNQVSVNTSNSAGVVLVSVGSGLSSAQAQQLLDIFRVHGLDSSMPMVASKVSRNIPADGSAIAQTVVEDTIAGTVTVQRT